MVQKRVSLPEKGFGFDSVHGKNSHSENGGCWVVLVGYSSAFDQKLSDLGGGGE